MTLIIGGKGEEILNHGDLLDMPDTAGSNTDHDTRYIISGSFAHDSLTGLSDDDHSQYALLAGRSGGQVLIGGIDSGDDLTLQSTSNGTKGSVFFGAAQTTVYDEVNDFFGVGTVPVTRLHIKGSSPTFRIEDTSPTGNPRIVFNQDSDGKGILEFLDANDDFRLWSGYGQLSFSTGTESAGVVRVIVKSGGDTSFESNNIINVATPVNGTDGANKDFVTDESILWAIILG